MKTAEEWMPAKAVCEVSPEWIKAIQLDAMKEGMKRAAKVVQIHQPPPYQAQKAILTAAEQLTEKDL